MEAHWNRSDYKSKGNTGWISSQPQNSIMGQPENGSLKVQSQESHEEAGSTLSQAEVQNFPCFCKATITA